MIKSPPVVPGQVPGTNTNDNANAGNFAQYIESIVLIGAAVPVANVTAVDITSIVVPAGDWNVCGLVELNPNAAAVITSMFGWISAASATIPTPPAGGFNQIFPPATAGIAPSIPIINIRFSLAAPTTIFLSMRGNFTSTMAGYGIISARRAR